MIVVRRSDALFRILSMIVVAMIIVICGLTAIRKRLYAIILLFD